MNIDQITLNLGGGQDGLRRLPPPGLARAPGVVKAQGLYSNAKHPEKLLTNSSEPGVIHDRRLVGRVATVEWQQKIDLSYSAGVADRAMGEIDVEVNQAKRDLIELTKMFPPYPHGSEERAELLNSYRSLRLQIERLTIPPESDLAARILGGSGAVGGDMLPPELRGFQVDAGREGLGLLVPQVPVEVLDDDDFPPLINDLDRASALLKERRLDLQLTFSGIFNQEGGDEALYVSLSLEIREQLSAFEATIGREKTGFHNDLPHLDWDA